MWTSTFHSLSEESGKLRKTELRDLGFVASVRILLVLMKTEER